MNFKISWRHMSTQLNTLVQYYLHAFFNLFRERFCDLLLFTVNSVNNNSKMNNTSEKKIINTTSLVCSNNNELTANGNTSPAANNISLLRIIILECLKILSVHTHLCSNGHAQKVYLIDRSQ